MQQYNDPKTNNSTKEWLKQKTCNAVWLTQSSDPMQTFDASWIQVGNSFVRHSELNSMFHKSNYSTCLFPKTHGCMEDGL